MLLIVLGGIGYIVWWDVLRVFKDLKKRKWKVLSNLTLHSKIALSSTGILLLSGAVLFLIFEYHNPLTMASYSLFDKIQVSLFQSVTTRTAGFVTVPQENFTNASAMISLLLMFVGGSPIGTAGGIKTVTIAVLIISAFATIQNKNEVAIFNRRIEAVYVKKALAVCFFSFAVAMFSTLCLTIVSDKSFLDLLFEAVSATATVGISRDVTSSLNLAGKIIIIITMYLGRVGPITMATLFYSQKEKTNTIKNPIEKIIVG